MAGETWKHTGPEKVFLALLDGYCQIVAFGFDIDGNRNTILFTVEEFHGSMDLR